MARYEVATLNFQIGKVAAALEHIRPAVTDPRRRGHLLACWVAEIGELNQVMIISGYDSDSDMLEEREQMILGGNPFGVSEVLTSMELDTFVQMPFLEALKPGAYGPVYEVRVYKFKPGGVSSTIALWRETIGPRAKLSPLLAAMYGLDGVAPRFMHIWPYPDLKARQDIRAEATATKVWPPKGGHASLETMSSRIYLPTSFSPLS
jgi:NIPSNAP